MKEVCVRLVLALGLSWAIAGCSDSGKADGDIAMDAGTDSTSGGQSSDGTSTETESLPTDSNTSQIQPSTDTTGCGDGVVEDGEACDDGNNASGDGCAGTCGAVENGYACLIPGKECTSLVMCGDGNVLGNEACDDANTSGGDGCGTDCQVEAGWSCPDVGKRCQAKACGDGIVAGKEQCDDGDTEAADGCGSDCRLEPGFACDVPGTGCHATVCGDGAKEGSEPCDDANGVVGDGCNPFCEVEPNCAAGPCVSACGDGLMLPGDLEECDDGNTKDSDGCSAQCLIEDGFACGQVSTALPDVLEVPATYRDFISLPQGVAVRHPDFERFAGSLATTGMVEASLGNDGKPVYTGICEEGAMPGPCPYGAQTTSKKNYDQWYRDTPTVNMTLVTHLSLNKQPNGTYFHETPPLPDGFFPLDNQGWVGTGEEQASAGHNFGFTSEIRYWFEFEGDESLQFSGDDDVWVFIAGKLALDLGGLHPRQNGAFVLDAATALGLGLETGLIYEIALFHAERHTGASNFNLTLGGFVSNKSVCQTVCGDGIVAGDEVCDDGDNDSTYGSCLADCSGRGPHCGDGDLQAADGESCDDGLNTGVYSDDGKPACAPGCKLGSFCGDKIVDSLFSEACDDGVNAGGFGECQPGCKLGARCGDGVVQTEGKEECDDGNSVSGDGCSSSCENEFGPV